MNARELLNRRLSDARDVCLNAIVQECVQQEVAGGLDEMSTELASRALGALGKSQTDYAKLVERERQTWLTIAANSKKTRGLSDGG